MPAMYFDHRWCAQHGIGRFASEIRARLPEFHDVPCGGSPTSLLDAARLSLALRKNNAQLYFSPGFNVPALPNCQVICTVHDLIHIHFKDESSILKRQYYQFIQRPIVRQSPLVLTVSDFSRTQISEWYGIPEEKVVCVGNGISERFQPPIDSVTSDFKYFLHVGNHKPHKNLPTLIRAFAKLDARRNVGLSLVGKLGVATKRLIEDLNLTGRVRVFSGIDDSQLAKLYQGAVATILPSFFEGFGLPLVEAMACACPVVGADSTAIPEVMGDAGLRFKPNDTNALIECMTRLLDDSRLRAELVEKGIKRARLFTWDRVGARVRDALNQVLLPNDQL